MHFKNILHWTVEYFTEILCTETRECIANLITDRVCRSIIVSNKLLSRNIILLKYIASDSDCGHVWRHIGQTVISMCNTANIYFGLMIILRTNRITMIHMIFFKLNYNDISLKKKIKKNTNIIRSVSHPRKQNQVKCIMRIAKKFVRK